MAKTLILKQLTHNMTTDCSLITDFSTRKTQVQNMLCTKIVVCYCFGIGIQNNVCTQHVLNLYFFLYWSQYIINEQSAIILWVNWFKNECFWKRFTCTCCNSPLGILYIIDVFWYYYGTIQVLRQQRGGWVGSENGNFCWFTVLFMLT